MTWQQKRALKSLTVVGFPSEQVKQIEHRFEDIVRYHLASFSAWQSMDVQMRRLALDCYLQGAIDGTQIPKRMLT